MNTTELVRKSHRILVVDDNPAIHEDIRKILCPPVHDDLSQEEAALFGTISPVIERSEFEIESAHQGQEGLGMVEKALADGRPYSMAFVDVRMPPGWDGIETIRQIWNRYPELQVVICTAYSDHSWDEIITHLGKSDSMVILKKPFDNIEVLQLAHALTKKWVVTRQAKYRLDNLEAVVERRTAELVSTNTRLQQEIERRTQVEVALRASEERFHKAFDTASIALAILHADTLQFTDVNNSFLVLAGHTRDQTIGKTPSALKLPEKPGSFDQIIKTLREGQRVHNLECNLRQADGLIRQTLISVVPLTLGGSACFLAAILDITDQRRLESQLRQSQKMEAIGQLAAGIAHDFNNLLTIIIGHASIQLAKANVDQEVTKSLEQVRLAGERASGLTRQLLAFSRKQVLKRSPVFIKHTVQNMESMLVRLVGETVRFECQCAENLPCVLADESNLEQVLLNLVVNARDSMPQGGLVRVTVETLDLFGNAVRRHADAREGHYVVLTVEDNGCGMTAETQRHLFEPFFTTKPVGKGTGLGLSTVYGIVKQHDGWIEVQSELAVGTTFRVLLPATEQRPNSQQTSFMAKSTLDRKESILVVEDEPLVRAFVCEALQHHGYNVLDADCGQKALEVWKQAGEQIDLLLTDMVMPNGISGSSLAKMLLDHNQNLKVIYMSGYSSEITGTGDLFSEARNFLPKPFSQGKLLDMVDRTMNNLDRRDYAIPATKISEKR
ncbi:MAG TPA: response regulator [Verrucomicrobiae bacterium]|nr:response regulator [Verrucomicrobiae bacterium]